MSTVEFWKGDPTEAELHRAAAWWAGEGSVSGADRKLRVTFAQKERGVCEWFQGLFGGTVTTRQPKGKHNEISYWAVYGDTAREFIRVIVDLIPESPRRQQQLRKALEDTAGRLKTGPKPTGVCLRGHQKKVSGRCSACAAIWRTTMMAKPGAVQKHRDQERDRYARRKASQS